jgi:porin
VERQLEEDAAVQPLVHLEILDPYREWKKGVHEAIGLQFAGDYSALGLYATESPGEHGAASGMLRFFGAWDLLDRDGDHPGALVWKVEHRHRMADAAPSSLGFEAGYVGVIGGPFNANDWRLTNLYWRQRVAGGRFTLIGGFLDATDYVDAYALGSPWTGFSNLVFSTGSAAIDLPNDATLGVAAGAMLTDNLYAIAGIVDANSDPEDPFEGFETFFEDHEYFSSVEIGWTRSHERLVLDNVHATLWHVDGRESSGARSGWGVNLSASLYLAERWLPFVRGGWTKDSGSLLERSLSLGVGYQGVPGRDLLGFAVNWGDPNPDSFGSGLDDQWSWEVFYRWQVLKELAVTPSLQLLVDPTLNPDEDTTWLLGLRLRYAL